MTIQTAQYGNPPHTTVRTINDDGGHSAGGYPGSNKFAQDVQAWVDAGNTIADYPHDSLKRLKYRENAEYAASQSHIAYSNPADGVTLDDHGVKKENIKRSNKAKRKVNKISQADDHLLSHIELIMDVLDTADSAVEALSTRDEIINWNPASVVWPGWTPK